MDQASLESLIRDWLLAWTGNQPDRLLAFYADDAYYQDPARSGGLRGQAELSKYFRELLAANPEWKWEPVEILPTARGCCLKWKATIPHGNEAITLVGLDIVEITHGKISRNEVYFDTSAFG
jgi:hypothetical protein